MNRLAIASLLAVLTLSGTAVAEWVRVDESDIAVVYADPATIRSMGSTARMWSLGDLKSPQEIRGKPYLSQKILDEHDCKDRRYRALHLSQHSGQMGSGTVVAVYSGDPGAWRPVPPGSTGEALWEFACRKASAAAEWLRITATDSAVIYADSTTILKADNTVRIWELSDFKTAQSSPTDGKPFSSLKTEGEYDCQGSRRRTLRIAAHSGQMGGGEIIYEGPGPGEWRPVVPGSFEDVVWKAVCGSK